MAIKNYQGADLPLVPGLPIVGSYWRFIHDRLAFLLEIADEYGNICAFRAGPRTFVFVNDPACAGEVLMDAGVKFTNHKPTSQSSLSPLLGQGVVYREGDAHKQHRRKLMPLFQPRAVSKYASAMTSVADATQAGWADGAELDLFQCMKGLTIGVIGRALLKRHEPRELAEFSTKFDVALKSALAERNSLLRLPSSWPTPRRARLQRSLGDVRALIDGWIDRARELDAEGDADDLVSALLRIRDEAGAGLSREQIRDDIQTLVFAGHETSASALTWIFYNLMQSPDTYARLRSEVDGALQGEIPVEGDLARLPLTSQVVKETLRLHPPAPVLYRRCISETSLGARRLPADAMVLVSPYVLHRSPIYFPDPMRFNPERFTPAMEKGLPRSAYIPFGDGPRVCLGAAFASLEAQLVLATLAQRVTFELAPGQRIEPDGSGVTLRPRGGIRVRVRRRDKRPQR